ncbi:MAG: substrate-binding domain-containing protein [Roseburia sp.]|nr:substrate-binding domain-containing protein [Roseburia sp.]MCM1098371.1 substrate-binding domain-containing protein [Ruminococcus flavefaciens]
MKRRDGSKTVGGSRKAGECKTAGGRGKIGKVGCIAITALGIGSLTVCGAAIRRNAANPSETIRLSGSTSMARLSGALAEGFMEKYPGITVTVEFTGSGSGLREAADGAVEIGNSSRELSEEEKASGVVGNRVALDGIAICVDPKNPVQGLTMDQLALIYTGGVNHWTFAGGEDIPIVVVGREAGSGTRSAFERQAGVEGICRYANELDSSGAVMAKVAATPGAIGYISLETAEDSVKLLKLDGIEAEPEMVREGRYPLARPYIMATRGEIGEQSQVVQLWFEYVYGEEGRKIIEGLGLAAERETPTGQASAERNAGQNAAERKTLAGQVSAERNAGQNAAERETPTGQASAEGNAGQYEAGQALTGQKTAEQKTTEQKPTARKPTEREETVRTVRQETAREAGGG